MQELINRYRQSINPPYKGRDYLNLFFTFLILLAIPVGVYLTNQKQPQQDVRTQATTADPMSIVQKYFVPETLVIKFAQRMDAAAKNSLLGQFGLSVSAQVPDSNMVIVHVPQSRIDQVLEALTGNPQIALVKKIELSSPAEEGNVNLPEPAQQRR